MGDAGHAVTGFGLVSFAWNMAFEEHLTDYISMERKMSNIIRGQSGKYLIQRAEFNNGIEPTIRNVVFGSSMMEYFIRESLACVPVEDLNQKVVQYVRTLYSAEVSLAHSVDAKVCFMDDDLVPVNEADAQCTVCGVSCLAFMFVEGEGEANAGVCAVCAHGLKDPRVVVLMSTFMSKRLGLV